MFFGKKKWNEKTLLDGCAANDRRAQEALYRQFFQEMWRMVSRRTDSDDEAMAIVNAGFLRVFQKIGSFERRGSLEGWIRRIVWRALADHFRERGRSLGFLVFEERDRQSPERGHDALFVEDLMKMIERLPPASRQVFKLFAIEGCSHREIAESLGISEGTSKWHLNNARTLLKEAIEHHEIAERRHVG